jgi:hypothetical protein
MPNLAHDDCASIELIYTTTQGPIMENSLYFSNQTGGGPFTSAQIQDMMDAVVTNWPLTVGPVTSPLVSLVAVRGQSIDTVPYGPVLEDIIATPLAGTAAGDSLPFGVCAVVQLFGDPGGRPRRSYIRMSGLVESQASGNVINNAARAAIGSAWGTLTTDIRDAGPLGTAKVILSEQLAGVPSAEQNVYSELGVRAALGRAASRSGTLP